MDEIGGNAHGLQAPRDIVTGKAGQKSEHSGLIP